MVLLQEEAVQVKLVNKEQQVILGQVKWVVQVAQAHI